MTTKNIVEIRLEQPSGGDSFRLAYAKRRAIATLGEIIKRTEDNEKTIVVLNLDGLDDLRLTFVQWYFENLARWFHETCTQSILVLDVTKTGDFQYWLDDLMPEDVFLVLYDHPDFFFVGSPPYLKEYFELLQDGSATREQLLDKFSAHDVIVDDALEHLIKYRIVSLSNGVYQHKLPMSLRRDEG